MIRPEIRERLWHWREVILSAALVVFGLRIAAIGGWLFPPIGLIVAALSLGWSVVALRRLRFIRPVGAPGIVETDEGQIGYFGPSFGGFVALNDVIELRLVDYHGKRQWRLRTDDGQVLSIPVDATGAERLFDAFAVLPGVDMATITAAIDGDGTSRPLWQRPKPGQMPILLDHDLS
ncbi:MAG: hypothetical protein KDE08_13075 [Rhodobacteraceae bacterium]|nr:hypothetical protein [Paracoccaceae bacterium]